MGSRGYPSLHSSIGKEIRWFGVPELRRLRRLEEENTQFKKLLANLSLDKQMLQDVIKKICEANLQKGDGRLAGR